MDQCGFQCSLKPGNGVHRTTRLVGERGQYREEQRVRYLVEVLAGGPHLLPRLVQQLDADAEELLEGAVVGEEHGVEVMAVLACCRGGGEGEPGVKLWGSLRPVVH